MSEEKQAEETVTVEIDSKTLLEQTLNDPELNKKLDIVASHFAEIAHNNWVTPEYLLKKSKIKNIKEMAGYLDLLVLTRKAFVKKQKDVLKYKITLTPEVRKQVLTNQIVDLKHSIQLLELELSSIS